MKCAAYKGYLDATKVTPRLRQASATMSETARRAREAAEKFDQVPEPSAEPAEAHASDSVAKTFAFATPTRHVADIQLKLTLLGLLTR